MPTREKYNTLSTTNMVIYMYDFSDAILRPYPFHSLPSTYFSDCMRSQKRIGYTIRSACLVKESNLGIISCDTVRATQYFHLFSCDSSTSIVYRQTISDDSDTLCTTAVTTAVTWVRVGNTRMTFACGT